MNKRSRSFHLRLSWKIFLLVFILSMLSSLFTIACISFFVPARFSGYAYSFEDTISDLQGELSQTENISEQRTILQQFSTSSGYPYSYQILYNNEQIEQETASLAEVDWVIEDPEGESITFSMEQDDVVTEITVFKNDSLIQEIFSTFVNSLVPILAWVLLLSLVLSWLYARFISRPIEQLDHISREMMDMSYRASVQTFSRDEIGELSRNVHILYARLSNTIDQLRERNRQQAEFFQAASHDLKTPLTIIQGSIEVLARQMESPPDSCRQYLENALKACQRMEKMISSILTLTRMEKKPRLSLQLTALDELVRKEIIALLPSIENRELTLEIDMDSSGEIRLDPDLFSTALRNLLINAIVYSEPGETIRVRLCQKEHPVLCVENTGVFLEENDLVHLFEPFYRADKSRNSNSGGNGLGLAITKDILEIHGFSIQAMNSSDGFLIRIDLTQSSESLHDNSIASF